MHITIIGAGALGRVYGNRLAAGGNEVSFVVRPSRAGETTAFAVEQVNGQHQRDVLEHPVRVTDIPARTRVVIVAVRFDQLVAAAKAPENDELVRILRNSPSVPIMVLTPLLPKQRAALEAAASRRIVPAMPSVSGYIDDRDVVRYWVVKVAATLIDELPATDTFEAARATLDDLARRLTKAGIPTHLQRDVGSLNAATTTAFFPLVGAINAGGGIDGVLSDKDLLATVLDAAKESDELGMKIGKVAPWAHYLTKFVGPYTLKPGVTMARALFPEAVRFAEIHFGPKLHAQHLAMGEAILDLAREHGQPTPALERLVGIFRARAAG
jgi:2-dehydropantoate 2-reductase